MKSLIGHDKGPGIANSVVLMSLIQHLFDTGTLSKIDITQILARADVELAEMGESNLAVKDARSVIAKMRADW